LEIRPDTVDEAWQKTRAELVLSEQRVLQMNSHVSCAKAHAVTMRVLSQHRLCSLELLCAPVMNCRKTSDLFESVSCPWMFEDLNYISSKLWGMTRLCVLADLQVVVMDDGSWRYGPCVREWD